MGRGFLPPLHSCGPASHSDRHPSVLLRLPGHPQGTHIAGFHVTTVMCEGVMWFCVMSSLMLRFGQFVGSLQAFGCLVGCDLSRNAD